MQTKDRPTWKEENKPFTLNLRVTNMEKTIKHLKEKNVKVKDVVNDQYCGLFSWCEDLDGNCIELWEDNKNNKEK